MGTRGFVIPKNCIDLARRYRRIDTKISLSIMNKNNYFSSFSLPDNIRSPVLKFLKFSCEVTEIEKKRKTEAFDLYFTASKFCR